MKLIFLDIDGVLNSTASWAAGCHPAGDRAMCPELVERLNRLIRESGAGVVVSSSWRGPSITSTRATLIANGVTGRMIGITPRLGETIEIQGKLYRTGERGLEIQAWLDENRRRWVVESFVILDDADDMSHLVRRLVRLVGSGWFQLVPLSCAEACP